MRGSPAAPRRAAPIFLDYPRRCAAGTLILLAVAAVIAGCKPPRPPHQVVEGDVSGTWSAEVSTTPPAAWRLALEPRAGGRITGSGAFTRDGQAARFAVRGIRGPREIQLDLHFDGTAARFVGSVFDVGTMVGRLFVEGDTATVTFLRR